MRKKLTDKEKKVRITVTINPALAKVINQYSNVSKYIEWLIYKDLRDKNEIKDMPL